MDKITTQTIVEKTVYKTSDGKIFDCERDALAHEEWLITMDKMRDIKTKNIYEYNLIYCEAYYIKSLNDFRNVIKYLKLSKYFAETDYRDADWYFFYHENNEPDKYYVETLTEKKRKWEELCKHFE